MNLVFCFFAAALIAGISSPGLATELQIPSRTATPDNTLELPVIIDEIDNLAGIKMVMTYDAKTLQFVKAVKTKHSSSLMHIVNDKKPGLLIVVMAGARGIKGKNLDILTLNFKIKPEAKIPGETQMKITELQLMSDKLKEIKAGIKVEPVKLLPSPPQPKKPPQNK